MTKPAICLTGAVCLRAGHPVLRGLELEVQAGEAVVVTGPNGTGKSTLLRVLAGLLPLAAGAGSVLDHDLVRERAAIRRSVSFVAHDSFGYDDLTVRRNLRFHARLGGIDAEATEAVSRQMGLTAIADRPHALLSAGQRRRSALAIAVMQRRELMLLDEPHAALDAEGRDVVNQVIEDSIRRGVAVVVVTHEADLVRPIVHREVSLQSGRLRTVGRL
jgi:heme ABC exporter ATP-binding subunit CcmA